MHLNNAVHELGNNDSEGQKMYLNESKRWFPPQTRI